MDPETSGEATILIRDPKADPKGKGIAAAPTPPVKASYNQPRGGWKKGVAILDFVLRLIALSTALAAASIMGTTEQTLPFFTQFFQFHAEFNDLPTFIFFVYANGIVGGYLILSLPFSIICIVRPHAVGPRLLLLILDLVAMVLTTAAASATAAIVYLAHNGSSDANWNAICQQFTDFCEQTSIAVINSFVTSLMLVFLVVLSAIALRRN